MQIVFALESVLKLDNERISSQLLHNFQLSKNLFVSPLLLHYKLLAHRLDRDQATRIFFPSKVNFFGKATFPYNFQFFEIIQRNLFSIHARSQVFREDCHQF